MSRDLTTEEEVTPLAARYALEAVLLFHSASPWDEDKKLRWAECCAFCELEPDRDSNGCEIGRAKEATTKVLCDMARAALGRKP